MSVDFIDIIPFKNQTKCEVVVPGSKSISNRALILAVLNDGEVKLNGILQSQDVDIMVNALKLLGVKIKSVDSGKSLIVFGCKGILPVKRATINVGNAGTVARFLTALLACQEGGEYFLDGSVPMRVRPMSGLLNELELHGTKFKFEGEINCFPFKMITTTLSNEGWDIDASESSQILSAILLITPLIPGDISLNLIGETVSKPFVQMTIEMIHQFSAIDSKRITQNGSNFNIPNINFNIPEGKYDIEPDATAASYFISLPLAVGGEVMVKNLQNCNLQGDIGFCNLVKEIGFTITRTELGIESKLDSNSKGGDFNFNDISDTFLSLAALSPLLPTPLKITGIAHTRKQETDRVSAMANELLKLGQKVEEKEDSLLIEPNLNKLLDSLPVVINTYDDHRFAMSFAILGSFDLFKNGSSWLRISNPNCCAKTFPRFFDVLSTIRNNSTNS